MIEMGIPIKVDSPGVGNNLQSQVGTGEVIFTLRDPVSFNPFRLYLNPLNLVSYLARKDGPLSGVSGFDGVGNIRVNPPANTSLTHQYHAAELAEEPSWPDMQISMLAIHLGILQKLHRLLYSVRRTFNFLL